MTPEPYIFAELAGQEMSWKDYETNPDYRYDENASSYFELIEQGKEVYSDRWDDAALNYIVIRRIADNRFFKCSGHYDSWENIGNYNSTGDYGGVVEVFPVQKTVYVTK